ncbi:tRNA (adenosine(37)-N6)-threonylcarbamoyltransferase complex ATPase subunit type 1 TsaE [Patescibacteria group bacterium]|nr:tRNA (adenosine(37)-N6)-threonylcarbamoyltransferase complex ATPase subunit type 1 TsaE [Patescibacteria group bacterium]
MKKILKNLKEMEKFAESFANKTSDSKLAGEAVVVGLYGDLGSGKTTFTKSFVSAFGVKQTVTSPTFVIEKIYKLPKENNFKHIIHIDAYRLNSGEEMKDLGWDKISTDPQNIILIEWPEKIADILPKNTKKIYFKFVDENTREIIF